MSRAVDEAARQLAGEVEVLRGEKEAMAVTLAHAQVQFRTLWKDYEALWAESQQLRRDRDDAVLAALRARAGMDGHPPGPARSDATLDAACHAHGMGQADGAADERAAIVGFLRRWFERPAYAGAHAWMLAGTREALAAIERGEHRAAAGASTATSSPTADAPNTGPIEILCLCGHPPDEHFEGGDIGWGPCKHRDGCTGSGTF